MTVQTPRGQGTSPFFFRQMLDPQHEQQCPGFSKCPEMYWFITLNAYGACHVLSTALKPLTVWITTNWKILQEKGISDHHTCLLRSLYAGQEAIVRTRHGTVDWFQIGKGVQQGSILSPCLFNLYAEYIMWNAGLDEAQAGIKIAGRNINNLRYADDTTLWQKAKRN